jgi:hypothetical protein
MGAMALAGSLWVVGRDVASFASFLALVVVVLALVELVRGDPA